MPTPLVKIPVAKKASNADLIFTMKKLSDILLDRQLNSPDFDTKQIFQALLGDNCFNSPDDIRVPFIVSDAVIAIPSVPPKRKSDGTAKSGKHVVPLIQVPGQEPYYCWTEGTETFIESDTASLRGRRTISLHKIIPGMIVSFHHYTHEDGMKERYRIDAISIEYDQDGHPGWTQLPEDAALFPMPDLNSGTHD